MQKSEKKPPFCVPCPHMGSDLWYNIRMTKGLSTAKTNSKDVLARCMATEDIMVQHSASAETAAFDTASRTLILPVWDDMDDALYDMLVGHEVSHALHTPMTGWQEFIGDGPGARMRHMFVNVVEDARIERLIKNKFPGLRRDFAAGYKNLSERDLFEIAGKDITELPLIDRLNLESKLGMLGLANIPFSTDDQQYVTRQNETETFKEVVDLARELYELQVEENKKQQEEQSQESDQGSPGAGDGEGSGTGSTPSDSDESGESDESGAGSSGEEGDQEGEGSSGGDESGEDSGASMTDDTDDGESAESTTGENGESGEGEGDQPSDLDYDDYENNQDCAGSTQNAFERGVDSLRDASSEDHQYSTIPSPNLDEIVVDYTKINDLWVNTQNSNRWNDDYSVGNRKIRGEELRTFQNSIKGTVAQMVQQFQMKQAADSDKRTSIAKTGVLDTVSMINYRWSEDIFLKNEVHTDGKNHGMVMYVDWSGSMANILQDTVEQLLVLVEFCRKVNIPYEVYAFSSNEYCPINDRSHDEWDEYMNNRPARWESDRDTDCRPHSFNLYNFLSSRMNKREYNSALGNLWLLTGACSHYQGHPHPSCLSLGCTPLNEAVVCAIDMVPAFQRANGIEIVNTVFLTDGEGHGMIGRHYYRGKTFVTDKKTRKTYEIDRSETNALLNMLRDRTGTNLVGIRLHDSKNLRFLRYTMEESEYAAAEKQYKTQNYVSLPSSYDEYFLVKGDLKVETDAMEDLGDNESYTKIKNAFMKGGNRRKSSRVIATKMVDIFAA